MILQSPRFLKLTSFIVAAIMTSSLVGYSYALPEIQTSYGYKTSDGFHFIDVKLDNIGNQTATKIEISFDAIGPGDFSFGFMEKMPKNTLEPGEKMFFQYYFSPQNVGDYEVNSIVNWEDEQGGTYGGFVEDPTIEISVDRIKDPPVTSTISSQWEIAIVIVILGVVAIFVIIYKEKNKKQITT